MGDKREKDMGRQGRNMERQEKERVTWGTGESKRHGKIRDTGGGKRERRTRDIFRGSYISLFSRLSLLREI